LEIFMTLTKKDLIRSIQQQNGYTDKQSSDIVETVLGQIKNCLESGDDVLISGFGKFQVKEKEERKGRRPGR